MGHPCTDSIRKNSGIVRGVGMYTYRNKMTGVIFTTVSECSGEELELISAPNATEEKKKPVKGKKK